MIFNNYVLMSFRSNVGGTFLVEILTSRVAILKSRWIWDIVKEQLFKIIMNALNVYSVRSCAWFIIWQHLSIITRQHWIEALKMDISLISFRFLKLSYLPGIGDRFNNRSHSRNKFKIAWEVIWLSEILLIESMRTNSSSWMNKHLSPNLQNFRFPW